MTMSSKQNIFITIIIIVLSGVLILGSFLIKDYLQKADSETKSVQEEIIENSKALPELQNEYPTTANINELYTFYPRVSDADSKSEDIKFLILEGPKWMSFSDGVISGTPLVGDIGNIKVVLRIFDETNYVDKVLYILVK